MLKNPKGICECQVVETGNMEEILSQALSQLLTMLQRKINVVLTESRSFPP